MTPELIITIAGFAITVAGIVFTAGRMTGRLDLIDQAQHAAQALNVQQQRTLDEKLTSVSQELLRLRDDKHQLLGTVMRHEGAIHENAKLISLVEQRVIQLERRA